MRYQDYQYSDSSQIVPNYWEQELMYMDERGKLGLEINDQGNLCIVGGKNKFTYAELDKDGVMHIKNIPIVWMNKKLWGLIRCTLMTAYGLNFNMYPERSLPTIYISKEYDDWRAKRAKYVVDDELTDGKVEGARNPTRIKKTTSTW
jgi:hypothetical protein